MNPAPMNRQPMMIDSRRLTVSATSPVGTSKTRAEISSAVPTRTSWSASRPATWMLYSALAVKTSM